MNEKLKNFCKRQTQRTNMYLEMITHNVAIGEPIMILTLSDLKGLLFTLKEAFDEDRKHDKLVILEKLKKLEDDADTRAEHERLTTNSRERILFYNGLAIAYDTVMDIIEEENND